MFTGRDLGSAEVIAQTQAALRKQPEWPFLVHFDVDVLDQTIMLAVGCPGSPGIDEVDLILLLRALATDERCTGITVTIFDLDLDAEAKHANRLVSLLRTVFHERTSI